MAHKIDAHNRLVFKRLTIKDQEIIENWLLGRKLMYNVKNNKVVNKKKGSKSGKTIYKITDEQYNVLNSLDVLTLKEFAILFNKELKFHSYDSVYSKLIRNKRVLDYLLTKQLINYNVRQRTRLGITAPIVYFNVNKSKTRELLDFYSIYLSSSTVNNYEDLKKQLEKTNKQHLLSSLEEKHLDKRKKERKRYAQRTIKGLKKKK